MPIPKKLLDKGVRDMIRISDARMSGTAYGTAILHVSPEAEAGGPLAIVRTGDTITLDAPNRSLNVQLSDAEIAERLQSWSGPETASKYERGYVKLYIEHVLQADEGCDLDFLVGSSGEKVDREAH